MKHDKATILEAAISNQKVLIHDLENRTKDIMTTDGNVNEEEYDSTEQSIKSSLIEEVEVLKEEIDFTKNELFELEKLKRHHQLATMVGPGAIVDTNRGTFFISVSIGSFTVGKSHFIGISTRSPLYKKMRGKKIGETFSFQETHYEIKDIY